MSSENGESIAPTTVTSTVTRSMSTETAGLPIQPAIFQSWVTHAIMGLFALGFIGWAAAVWNATDLVKRHAVEMESMRAEMEHLRRDVDQIQPTANQAEVIHAKLEQEQVNLQQQIDRRLGDLQREMGELKAREYRAHDEQGRPRSR